MAVLPVRRISRTKTCARGKCSAFSAGGEGGEGKVHCGGGLGGCSSSSCGRRSPDRPLGSTRKLCCAWTAVWVKTARTSQAHGNIPLRTQPGFALVAPSLRTIVTLSTTRPLSRFHRSYHLSDKTANPAILDHSPFNIPASRSPRANFCSAYKSGDHEKRAQAA